MAFCWMKLTRLPISSKAVGSVTDVGDVLHIAICTYVPRRRRRHSM